MRIAVIVGVLLAIAACDDEPGASSSADAGPEAGVDASPDLADLLDTQDGSDAASDIDTGSSDASLSEAGEDTSADTSADIPGEDVPADAPIDEAFRSCLGLTPPEYEAEGDFEHARSDAISDSQAGHSVEDLIATLPLAGLEVEGKFAYGTLSLDLEDEAVTAFLDTCDGWLLLGEARTDSDGRVRFDVPTLPGPGRYAVHMIVAGDGTVARGYVLAVPPETRFVVFDIDGTLTTGDSELILEYITELFGGSYVPEAYADAGAIVRAYAEAGWEIVYLTGRPYWLDAISRLWLEDGQFPVGTLHLTRDLGESIPSESGVGDYKLAYLQGILEEHEIFRAYGNATTDIYAYLGAGIPAGDVYIIGENAGAEGTQAIESYADHLGAIEIPLAEQPW